MTETGGEIRVLHVDDDPSFQEIVATYLEDEDDALTVESASDAETGIQQVIDGTFDCIVSDYKMPEMDGLAFLSTVRDHDEAIPFILYTGHGSEEIASEAISAGVTEYMQKETGTDQYTVLANTIRNAVEHARTEAALEESKERYRTLVEQSHDGIFIYRDNHLTFVNDQLCDIVGYDRETLTSIPIWELIHEDDRERIRSIAERQREGKDVPERYRTRVVTADGEVRDVEVNAHATTYEGEYGGIGAVRDITDRQKQEQRLEEFAGIVAHDIRNPLNVIGGRVDLARQECDSPHLDAIGRSVRKMEDLIVDMRELASNGAPLRGTDVVDLAAVVERAWPDGDLTLTIAGELPAVEGDEDRIERLFAELFDNVSVHAEATTVTVEPIPGGFAVVDDGTGIPESEHERVLEAGYSTDTDRTGFGLTIAGWIADAHGWTVTITDGEAGGTRIEVTDVVTV